VLPKASGGDERSNLGTLFFESRGEFAIYNPVFGRTENLPFQEVTTVYQPSLPPRQAPQTVRVFGNRAYSVAVERPPLKR
jgi:hypothetical protein